MFFRNVVIAVGLDTHNNSHISTICRTLHTISAENLTHHTALAFGMAYNYSNGRVNYSSRGDTQILLPKKVDLKCS